MARWRSSTSPALFVFLGIARARVGRRRTRHARRHPRPWALVAPAAKAHRRVGPRGDAGPSRAAASSRIAVRRACADRVRGDPRRSRLVPWTLTSPGQFVVHPLSTQVVTRAGQRHHRAGLRRRRDARERGSTARSTRRSRIRARDPRRRSRDRFAHGRRSRRRDRPAALATQAGLTAERTSAVAALERARAASRRASPFARRSHGSVATARPEDLVGRRVGCGRFAARARRAGFGRASRRAARRRRDARSARDRSCMRSRSPTRPHHGARGVGRVVGRRESRQRWWLVEARVRRSAATRGDLEPSARRASSWALERARRALVEARQLLRVYLLNRRLWRAS